MRILWKLFLVLVALQSAVALAIPSRGRPISDFDEILTEEERQSLFEVVDRVEKSTGAEIYVVTVRTLEDLTIEEYASRLFEEWKIGKKKKNNGLLILVCTSARKMRIETGYGLEGIITDAIASRVTSHVLRPAFKRRQYGVGLQSAVDLLASFIEKSRDAQEWRKQVDEGDEFPIWIQVPLLIFIGAFVAVGAGSIGVGFGAKTVFMILFGGIFVAVATVFVLVITAFAWWGLVLEAGVIAFAFINGFKRGRKDPSKHRGDMAKGKTGWVLGVDKNPRGRSGSGSSGRGGGSSGWSGGGSSGGGGSSSSW